MTHFIVAPKVWENFQMIDCFGEYESLTINELIEVLQLLDHEYHNKAGLVSDQLYDELWQHAYANAPHHSYFKSVGSRVGSDVRGGKIKLPFKMGSLNQVYIGEIESWVKDNNLEHHTIVISDKLDGTSGMALYSRTLQIGYSRGDGVEGADITRHFTRMSSIPKQVDSCGNMNVRGENIISHANFPGLQVASKRAKPFANPRNAVAGIMNSSENDDIIYDFVDFVAYDIVGSDVLGKHNTLSLLKASGFKIPWYVLAQGNQLTDEILADILNKRRAESPYQIDGLVLDVDCPVKRDEMNKGNDGLNPKFSIKYKVADEDNIADAVCEYVEWNLSKHRYFKPRLKIEPIQLCGVTVSYAQGFNAKFIKDNNIGPGSIIKITRAGDVIPHIVGGVKNPQIVHSTYAQMPDEEYVWTETGVDILLKSDEHRDDVVIGQLIDFFTKLKVPGLKEGNITAMVQAGYITPQSIIKLSLEELQDAINSEIIGEKVYEGIRKSLINVPFERLMGAYSTSRGIGIRKVNSVYKVLGLGLLEITNPAQLLNIDGIKDKTAIKVLDEIKLFRDFIVDIQGYFNFAEVPVATDKNTGLFANQHVVVTGFRDDELEKFIEDNGGVMQSGVSKKTTLVIAADPSENSTKLQKARSFDIRIMSQDNFRTEYGLN